MHKCVRTESTTCTNVYVLNGNCASRRMRGIGWHLLMKMIGNICASLPLLVCMAVMQEWWLQMVPIACGVLHNNRLLTGNYLLYSRIAFQIAIDM